jgi:tetratricopeptide (TPR) repeat protein
MFRNEMMVNTLAEALLCIRSKRFQDGARAFVQILDDKPVEHQVLTPYLTTLQKRNPQRGGIAYALGCSCLAAEEWDRGINMILQGVSLAPTNADDACERIEALRDVPGVSVARVELALAELKILRGEEREAVEMLRKVLDRSETKASEILDLLETHIDEDRDLPALDYLYIETAMIASRSAHALQHIKRVYADRRRSGELLTWLDEKSKDRPMTAEMLACYGEMLLEQQMYERAIEVLRDLLSKEPHQAVSVRELVAAHRSSNTAVADYYDELAGGETHRGPDDDGFSIEHYGSRDFTLDGKDRDPQPREVTPERTVGTTSSVRRGKFTRAAWDDDIFERERSMDLGGADDAETSPEEGAIEMGLERSSGIAAMNDEVADISASVAATDEMRAETSASVDRTDDVRVEASAAVDAADDTGVEEPACIDAADDTGVEEPACIDAADDAGVEEPACIDATDDALGQSDDGRGPSGGWAESIEVSGTTGSSDEWDDEEASASRSSAGTQDEIPSGDIPVHSGEPILLGMSDILGDDEGAGETGEETTSEAADFDSRCRAFANGDLDNDEVLALIERAARSGRMDAMKKLLEFKPDNLAQEVKRKYYLTEYYLREDQPLSALVVLKTVNINGLGKEERKGFLLKHAYCYQQLNQFDAAQSAYLRIMSEYPEDRAVEDMAKACYQRYLQSSESSGPVLEKVGSLGTPDEEEEEL